MKTRTYPSIVKRVYGALGRSGVTHHQPTSSNMIGQSGVHTFAEDLMDIVLKSSNEQEAYRRLHNYLHDGELTL